MKKREELIEINEKLATIRGMVISSTTRIEFILGYKLRRYFLPKTNAKSALLFWNVINTSYLSFDAKISIYESIPYFEKLKCFSEIQKSLRFIQQLRNVMAHWELDEANSDLENIILFTFFNRYRTRTINSSLIEEFKQHEANLLKRFGYSR